MAIQFRKMTSDNLVSLRKVHVSIPTGREEDKELGADLRRMGCLGLLEKSWRVRREEMVRELVTGEANHVYASTIRGRPDRWNAELWSRVYGFKQREEGIVEAPASSRCQQEQSQGESVGSERNQASRVASMNGADGESLETARNNGSRSPRKPADRAPKASWPKAGERAKTRESSPG